MRRRRFILMSVGSLGLTFSCRRDQSPSDPKPPGPAVETTIAPLRKEIIAQNVLAAQLAAHYEVEGKTTFRTTELIEASLYLANSTRVEPRRISAFLVREQTSREETIIEEHSLVIAAGETRQEFDFRFSEAPRPLGAYQIRFVEIARSNGKPVLLARLFLNIE
ncbi:MAG TPA: hypothetical protein VKJ45_12960 [Blastocatellia bacterium]|nr:hypothetical protein [Blastocatellia bacterium]